jgi:hypothetical protein
MEKPKSKRDMLRAGIAKPRQELSDQQRENLGKGLLGSREKLRSFLVGLPSEDHAWLDQTVANLKRHRPRTNKSDLVRLALNLLKEKKEDEIGHFLRQMDWQ